MAAMRSRKPIRRSEDVGRCVSCRRMLGRVEGGHEGGKAVHSTRKLNEAVVYYWRRRYPLAGEKAAAVAAGAFAAPSGRRMLPLFNIVSAGATGKWVRRPAGARRGAGWVFLSGSEDARRQAKECVRGAGVARRTTCLEGT